MDEEGSFVEQDELLGLRGIAGEIQSLKSRLSRAVAITFPSSIKKRLQRNDKQMYPFHNKNCMIPLWVNANMTASGF